MSELNYDPNKQIKHVGLKRTGQGSYKCKYPQLLADWLRQQDYKDLEPDFDYELAVLSQDAGRVSVRKSGAIVFYGTGDGWYRFEELIKPLLGEGSQADE